MRVKFLVGTDYNDLECQINDFISTHSDVKVDVNFENIAAVVTFDSDSKTMCMDCGFWDDGGEHDSLIGLCQCNGGRKRFNSKSCGDFKDRRG